MDNTNGVSGSEEAKNEPEVEPTNVPSEPVELMDQDEKEKNATEETPKPDSTPNNGELRLLIIFLNEGWTFADLI